MLVPIVLSAHVDVFALASITLEFPDQGLPQGSKHRCELGFFSRQVKT